MSGHSLSVGRTENDGKGGKSNFTEEKADKPHINPMDTVNVSLGKSC